MKIIAKGKSYKNQKGQAVLEYVLLLVVIVAIAITVMSYIAGATSRFFQNYYGDYFSCLLETGELPSLGADGNQETECDDLYQPFTLADGRAPNQNGNNSGNGNNGNGDSTDKNNQDDQASKADSTGAGAGSSEAGGGGSYASSSSGGFGASSGRQSRVPLSKADGGGGGGDEEDSDGVFRYNNFQQSEDSSSSGSGRSEYVPVYGSLGVEEEEEQKSSAPVKASEVQNPEQTLRAKRIPAKAGTKEDKGIQSDEDLGLPDFLRYLIIAAIIIIIIVFFGGQVMQYQKSKD